MSKFKRPIAFLLAIGLTFGSAGILTANASRANTGWYTSDFGSFGKTSDYTGARVKETNTRTYFKLTDYGRKPNGSYTTNDTDFFVVRGEDANLPVTGQTVTANSSHKGVDLYITNAAYKKGIRNIRLKMATRWLIGGFYIEGVWSPDSGLANVSPYK